MAHPYRLECCVTNKSYSIGLLFKAAIISWKALVDLQKFIEGEGCR